MVQHLRLLNRKQGIAGLTVLSGMPKILLALNHQAAEIARQAVSIFILIR